MTVGALLKYQRLPEISLGVALHTVHLGVFAEQRKFRPGMVKRAIQARRRHLVPSGGAVAGLAGLRKASAVRIRMAIGAAVKRYSGVARFFVWPRSVALLAIDLRMQARERVMRE